MKNNIKTNLKLAAVCSAATMTLSGCIKHVNVIENISSDKILVRDVVDGQQRIIEFRPDYQTGNLYYESKLKNSYVGDTIVFAANGRLPYKNNQCFIARVDGVVHFDEKLIAKRQERAKFDCLEGVTIRKNQGKQR